MYFTINLHLNQHAQPFISVFLDWCIYKKFPEAQDLPLKIIYSHILKKRAVREKTTLKFFVQLLLKHFEK